MGLALKLATIIEARLPLLKLQNKQIFENFIKMLRNNSSSEIPIISSPKVLPLMIDYIEAENEYQALKKNYAPLHDVESLAKIKITAKYCGLELPKTLIVEADTEASVKHNDD